MLDSLARRPRLHPLAARLTASPWLAAAVRRAGGLPTAGEIAQLTRQTQADAAGEAASAALLELAELRTVVPDEPARPVSLELAARLPDDAVARLEGVVRADPHWPAEMSAGLRAVALLDAAMDEGDGDALAAAGLRPHDPPGDVHAMDRGPLAAARALEIADLVVSSLADAGRPLQDGDVVLDFGCSSGRVAVPLAAGRPELDVLGCDPNGAAIAWAAEHVPVGRFFVSEQRPPLGLDDASVDVAYAISIWSHFAESAAREWLDEMHRVLRPEGRLLLTTHGAYSLGLYQRVHRETAGAQGLSGEHVVEAQRALAARGAWWFDSFGQAGDWGVQAPTWGHAHYLPEWILEATSGRWATTSYRQAALFGNQDVYVLARV